MARANKKKKVTIAPEDQVVAANLGVKEDKPKVDVKEERRKYRVAREAARNLGAMPAGKGREIADTQRYEEKLAAMAGKGPERQFVPIEEAPVEDVLKAREGLKKKQTTRKMREQRRTALETKKKDKGRDVYVGTGRLDEGELKKSALREKERKAKDPARQNIFTMLGGKAPGKYQKTNIKSPVVEKESPLEQAALAISQADRLKKKAAERAAKPDNAQEGQSAIENAVQQTKKSRPGRLVGAPQYDPMAATAKLRPLDRGLAPSAYSFMEDFGKTATAKLEEAKPVIAEKTGKPVESISYSGDEPYDVKDSSGNVVATRTVNSHALQLAQKSHRQAKSLGKEVNGIKPTDPRPSKVEDILGTPHQAMAYQLRHLPGLTEEDVLGTPGLSREKFKVKSEALMRAAVNKAESTRKINVSNEVQKGHKGWEDEKGIVHPFVFQKDGKVSPLSLPSEPFERTAQPKIMIHTPSEDADTEELMGAQQVAASEKSPETPAALMTAQKLGKSGMPATIKSYEPDAVASHEGWTLHDDGVWRKIQHPLTNVPESEKMHAADYVAAQAAMLVEDKKAAAANKKNKGRKKAVSELSNALANTQVAMTSQKRPYHYATNPKPPKSQNMLLRDKGAIAKALKSGKITQEQAEEFSPSLRAKEPQGELIKQAQPGPKEFKYLSKDEKKSLSRKELIDYNKAAAAAKAQTMEGFQKRIAKSLSPRKSFYNRFVDVKPIGKTESSKFLKAKGEVTAGRQWRTVELGETIPTVVNEQTMEQVPGLTQDQKAAVKSLGTAVVKAKNTFGLTEKEARNKKTIGARTAQVMADERGPVKDTEVFAHMQGMPSREDVKLAVKTGKISKEEGREARTLDQFSRFRPTDEPKLVVKPSGTEGIKTTKVGSTTAMEYSSNVKSPKEQYRLAAKAARTERGKEGIVNLKYSRLFEPVMRDIAPSATRPDKMKTQSVEEINKKTKIGATPTSVKTSVMKKGKPVKDKEGNMIMTSYPDTTLSGGPTKEIKEPTGKKAKPVKVSKSMQRVYGEIVPLPKEKPEVRGQMGSVKEGRGRQWSNYQGPVNFNVVNPKTGKFQGTTAVHPTLGRGYVVDYHDAGSNVPGTGKIVSAGNATSFTKTGERREQRATKRVGAETFSVPHVSFVPDTAREKTIHVPVSDFQ